MYISDFVCTYKLHDEEHKEIMYRLQFLQALNLKTWDDKLVEEELSSLYDLIKENEDIKGIIAKARTSKKLEMLLLFSGNNDITIFKMLFKFELFDMTHRCICDLMAKNSILTTNKELLLNNL
mgnify:CR=1 FL=1